MKLLILSDLHLEFAPFVPDTVDADVVVLAGDIATGTYGVEWAGRAFPDKPVVYVPGNHEYYGGHLSKVAIELQKTAHDNVHVLDNREWVSNGVRFLGATLWTDFALFGEAWRLPALAAAKNNMSDFNSIFYGSTGFFTPEQSVTLHQATVEWLKLKLKESFPGPTVVVTHHVPHRGSIAPHYAKDMLTAAFTSDLEHLMGFSALWVHGHTHTPCDYEVAGTRIVCNPRGYGRKISLPPGIHVDRNAPGYQFENQGFQPGLVVEI